VVANVSGLLMRMGFQRVIIGGSCKFMGGFFCMVHIMGGLFREG
jgi:hypothetical protein